MCVFLISPVPIAEPLTSELIDTPVFHNLGPRPIKYRVSVPIPSDTVITGVTSGQLTSGKISSPSQPYKRVQSHVKWM